MEHRRSLFGPLLLIAAGVIWLLVKSGTIPSENLWALTHIWPFLLIAAGLGLILRPYWSYTSMVLDVILIGGAVLAILYAPQLGWTNPSIITMINNGDFFVGPSERGSGNVVTETRDVSNFHSIEISYPAQVLIKQGGKESLQIEAEDNLLPGLQTQVRNNTLEIFYKTKNGKHINPTKMPTITIVVKDLASLDFTSAGDLTIDALKTDKLDVSLSGAGNLKLNKIVAKALGVNLSGAGSMSASGTADDLNLSISGFGDFKGADLHSKDAKVEISGAGGATVWADNNLNAQISGAGSISYYGSASVTKQVSGVGGINHLGNK
jgi:putative autotransporter adhesin-like protein/cell wall-active antibiotic response 4TMS protein YvqF